MAGTHDFDDAIAGASWTRTLTWARKNADGSSTPYDLTAASYGIFRLVSGDVVELGQVTLGGTTGVITFKLSDEQTFRLQGRARYTLAVVFGADDVRPVLNGTFLTGRSALVPVSGV